MTQAVEALMTTIFEELDLTRLRLVPQLIMKKAGLFLKGWDLLEKVLFLTMNY